LDLSFLALHLQAIPGMLITGDGLPEAPLHSFWGFSFAESLQENTDSLSRIFIRILF
jgi:hypothetical protein